MTAKEGIDQIKKLLFGEQPAVVPAAPAPEQKMQDVKTADGKVLVVDKLEVGGNVLLDGIAAPDGEYALEDGSILQVAGGLIVELSTATEDAIPEEAPAAAPAPSEMAQFKAEFDLFKQEFGAQKQAFSAVQSELAANKEAFTQLLSVVELMSNASVQQPVVAPKAFAEMTPIERFRAAKQYN
jgi:hypothetical protein